MRKTSLCITAGVAIGLAPMLHAELDTPVDGLNYNSLIGGESDQAWSFWVRTFVGYNDNVQLLPDFGFLGIDEESGYVGVTAQGSYGFWENGNFSAGAAFRYDQTHHFQSSGPTPADDFDLTVFQPAVYLNYQSGDWYGRASYSYRWEDAKTQLIGVGSHNLGLMVGRNINACLDLELSWTHGWDDFHTGGFGVLERDGERDKYSISLIHQGHENGMRLIARYSYLDNDAEGSFYEYQGHEYSLRLEKPLTANLGLVAQVTYTDLDYDPTFRADQDFLSAGIQLIYIIDDNWSADIYYNYLDIDSDLAILDSERNNFGVGLRYDF